MSLISNDAERTKLTAAWLNGLAVASTAAGAIAPAVAAFYGVSGPQGRGLLVGIVAWIAVGLCLHLLARTVLRGT